VVVFSDNGVIPCTQTGFQNRGIGARGDTALLVVTNASHQLPALETSRDELTQRITNFRAGTAVPRVSALATIVPRAPGLLMEDWWNATLASPLLVEGQVVARVRALRYRARTRAGSNISP
jgi:hypothetical protein